MAIGNRKPLNADSAIAQGVDGLLREFRSLGKRSVGVGGGPSDDQFVGPIESSYLVAASDARPQIRALADFVCSGTSDQLEINAALENVASDTFGRVVLSAGTFFIDGQVLIESDNTWLQGSGIGVTTLLVTDGEWPDSTPGVKVLGLTGIPPRGVKVSDFMLLTQASGATSVHGEGGVWVQGDTVVENVEVNQPIEVFSTGIFLASLNPGSDYAKVIECVVRGSNADTTTTGVYSNGAFSNITDCIMEFCTTGLVANTNGITVTGCVVTDARDIGFNLVASGITLSGSIVRDSPKATKGITSTGRNTITGNALETTGADNVFETVGIRATQGVVSNNALIRSGEEAGIDLKGNTSERLVCSGNSVHMEDASIVGIRIDGGQIICIGNVLSGDSTTAPAIGIELENAVADNPIIIGNRVDGYGIGIALGDGGSGTLSDSLLVGNMVFGGSTGLQYKGNLGDVYLFGNFIDGTTPVDDISTSIGAVTEDIASPLTTKGDMWVYGTGDTRLAVGSNGSRLVTDSSTATGLKWTAPKASGQVHVSTPAATAIAAIGTAVKAAGTTLLATTPTAVGFTMPSNNRLTYGGTDTKKFLITATISATSVSNTQTLGFHIAEGGVVNAASSIERLWNTGTDKGVVTVQAFVELATSEYVEVFVSNETSTGNLQIEQMTMTVVEV